jgi:hypothetical protein
MVHATGPIMTRTSLRSLVMKRWNPSYWMQYGGHTLFVFRSRDHMVRKENESPLSAQLSLLPSFFLL